MKKTFFFAACLCFAAAGALHAQEGLDPETMKMMQQYQQQSQDVPSELLALMPKRWTVFFLAGAYLLSLLLPIQPNEKRTVVAFSAFAAAAIALDGPFSVKLGCFLIALLVVYKNWRDAQIKLRLLDRFLH